MGYDLPVPGLTCILNRLFNEVGHGVSNISKIGSYVVQNIQTLSLKETF